MAKLQDLIAKCDESEIFTQNLADNAVEMKTKGKNGILNGYITFATDPKFVFEELEGNPSKIGIVIWLPSDVFER